MTLAVSRAFMVGVEEQDKSSDIEQQPDKEPVDTDSSKASGIASRFQKSMNVHRGTCVSIELTLHQSFLYFTCFTLYASLKLDMFRCPECHTRCKYSITTSRISIKR